MTNESQITVVEPARIESLLRRARKRFSTYWTVFQEMGIRGELPEWVREGFPNVGRHEDYDAQSSDQTETDKAFKGGYVPCKYSFGLDTKNTAYVHRQDGSLIFEGKPSELPAKHADVLFEFTASQLQMYVHALRSETFGHEVAYG